MNRLLLISCLLLSACGPRVEVLNLDKVPPTEKAQAASIEIYQTGHNVRSKIIAPVEATSCKHLLTDPPPSKADATNQLRIKTLRMGGNVITDYSCDDFGTDTWGTNCWASVTCAGNAGKK